MICNRAEAQCESIPAAMEPSQSSFYKVGIARVPLSEIDPSSRAARLLPAKIDRDARFDDSQRCQFIHHIMTTHLGRLELPETDD
jgi:hypothetical protein